jgi:hypothetical protein
MLPLAWISTEQNLANGCWGRDGSGRQKERVVVPPGYEDRLVDEI